MTGTDSAIYSTHLAQIYFHEQTLDRFVAPARSAYARTILTTQNGQPIRLVSLLTLFLFEQQSMNEVFVELDCRRERIFDGLQGLDPASILRDASVLGC